MKSVAVTLKGIESIAGEEIKEIAKTKTRKIIDGRVLFETKNLKPLEKARTIEKLYRYLDHFSFKKKEDIYKKAKKIKYPIKKNFVVRCYREGKHRFSSKEIEAKIGEIIFERGHKVKLKNPQTTVYVEIIGKHCIIGILHKKDMQKRKYKIRLNPASINACLASAMIRFAKVEKKHVLVDPFCKDGVMPIEAALMGIKNVYGFDESLNNVKNSRVNSQLAKVKISLGKAEVDWLDTKFEKHSVDRIVTNPPFPAKHRNKTEIEKTTKEFIQQAKYVLKKDGILVIVSPKTKFIDKYAKEYGFKLIKTINVVVGDSIYKGEAFKP